MPPGAHLVPSERSGPLVAALAALLAALVLGSPGRAVAAQCDCGQPSSNGPRPSVRDCLHALRIPLSLSTCEPCEPCVCDLNGDGRVTASDALLCLHAVVGSPVDLRRCCGDPPQYGRFDGAEVYVDGDEGLDYGWNGRLHGSALAAGRAFAVGFVGACEGSGTPCRQDSECAGDDACVRTCTSNDPAAPSCNLYGPVGPRRCKELTHLRCTSNADCPGSLPCVHVLGAPHPLQASGTPTCLLTTFADDITGTHHFASGATRLATKLRSQMRLGITLEQPCPVCGGRRDDAAIGESSVCDGGPADGEPCTVHAVSERFGATSNDCPPSYPAATSGIGQLIRIDELTTGRTTEIQARLPCGGFLADQHPSSGNAVCLDDFSPCASNADCARCAASLVPCTNDADCGDAGPCAAAPEQPVHCGLYCHCGVCSDDHTRACTADEQCSPGAGCVAHPRNDQSQAQPNPCENFICGDAVTERCCGTQDGERCVGFGPTPGVGHCSGASSTECSRDEHCPPPQTCETSEERRRCFEATVSRSGEPSSIGSYCSEPPERLVRCASDNDCSTGRCLHDVARPTLAAVTCPNVATTSSAINVAYGLPGPLALRLPSKLHYCECGNGRVECAEACDDGNQAGGDGCDEDCRIEP